MSEPQRRRRPIQDSQHNPYEAPALGDAPSPDDYDAIRIARMEARNRASANYEPAPEAHSRPQNRANYAETVSYPVQPPVIVNQVSVNNSVSDISGQSYFDGGLLQLIGWTLLGALITICTLGICFPFAACMIYSWEAKHTVINGRRLYFDGTGIQLLGKWIIWLLLTLITLGIYGFWLNISLKKWRIKHTHF